MRDYDLPLSPEQRLQEIAAILATGVLRLRKRAAFGEPGAARESRSSSLEDAAANSLTVHAGSRMETRRKEAA